MKDDLIYRQAAIDVIQKYKCEHGYAYADCACDIEKDLKALPSAQPDISSYLTDRPCAVCKCHTEDGCSKWECVFERRIND